MTKKTKKNALTPIAALIALSATQLALAQTNEAEATQELSSVVVSASRNDTLLEQMPSSTTIITQDDIKKSSAQSVDQLLKTIPGFNFTGAPSYLTDPTGTQTKMRGLGNDKVLVLLDGIPIIDPFYETTQWFRVPLASVERIEVMRGGASSTWGSMAVGGVVNIITKTPKDNGGEATVSGGSQGTINASASKNVVLSDTLTLHLSVNRFDTQGYQTTPAQYLWMYPDKQAPTDTNTAYQMALFYTPSADFKAFLRFGYFDQNQNLYGVYGVNDQTSPEISGGVTKRFDDHSSLDTKFWAQNVTFDKTNGASCYLISSKCESGGTSTVPTAPTTNIANYYSQYGAQFYTERGASSVFSKSYSGFWNNMQVGVDYRQLAVNDTEQYYSAPTVSGTTLTNQQPLDYTATGTGTQTFTGLFLQGKFSPVDAMQVTVSARYDDWENSNRAYSLINTAGQMSAGSGPSANVGKTQIDPSIGVHYDVSDELSLRSSAYQAFRAPGLNNQTRSYGSTIANPDLTPETVTGWELGSDYSHGNSKFGFTYFANTITNMIATSTVAAGAGEPQPVVNLCNTSTTNTPNVANCSGTGSVSFYTNNQNGQSNGVELTERWKVKDNLTLDAFYTYTSTYLTSAWNGVTTPLNTQLAGVPTTTASLSVTWLPVEKLQLFAQAYYIGPLSFQETGNTSGALLANYVQGSNTIFNGSVNYAADAQTDLFVNGTNLFNRVYQDGTYTATSPQGMTLSPPRTLMFGVTHRF